MAVAGIMTSISFLNRSASTIKASFAPVDDPIIAITMQRAALRHGIYPRLASLYVATVVPMPELSLFVAMALWTGRPAIM